MSPEEIALLQHAGQTLLFNIGVIVTQSILYGLYLAIVAFGIRALLKRHLWSKYTWILFGILSALFVLSTVDLAIIVAGNVDLIQGGLIDNPGLPLPDRFQLADASANVLNIVQIWSGAGTGGGFLFIFADAVVVWRAYVLWPGNKLAQVLPFALLSISTVFAIVSATIETISSVPGVNTVPSASVTGIMLTLSLSLSLATNAVATMLIGYKAYHHRKMMKFTIGVQNSRAGAILLFLTESGVVFCIFQAVALATGQFDNTAFATLDYVAITWSQITLFAAVAYPALVLVIVDSHRSISDHTRGSVGDSGGSNASSLNVGSHISFAARPPGVSITSSGIGEDSFVGSRIDPTARLRDVEKAEGLAESH